MCRVYGKWSNTANRIKSWVLPPLELAFNLPAVQSSGRLGPNRVFQQALPRVAAYVQDNLEA